ANELAAEAIDFHRALLRTDLKDAVVLADVVDEDAAFADVCGERLLGVNVVAGLHGDDARTRAGVIGRGDDHGVELFVVEHLPVFWVDLPVDVAALGGFSGAFYEAIGGCDDATAGRNLVDELVSATADTDHADEDLFAGRWRGIKSKDSAGDKRWCGEG